MLDLPSVVTFCDKITITYTYSADGIKLRTAHKIGSTTTTTGYCGSVIYENGVRKMLLTEEGYINLTGVQQYHYYLKDHQGNNRVVINQGGTAEEQTIIILSEGCLQLLLVMYSRTSITERNMIPERV